MSNISSTFMNGPKFGDPFILPSTASFPRDIKSTLDLCLYLWRINRIYGAVTNRIVSYFITELEFTGDNKGNADEKASLNKMLVDKLQLFSKLQQAGVEWAIYGNAFMRCVEPFDRWLVDSRGGKFRTVSLSAFPEDLVTYNWENMTYNVPDLTMYDKLSKDERGDLTKLPKVDLEFKDKPSAAPDRFSIVFLDPRYVDLDQPHHSDDIEYVYRVPPSMESRIKANSLHEINNTPRGLLKAVKDNKDFRFHKGEVYHLKGPTPAGVSESGWGVPEILLHYDALYQLQVYRKADYAIAQDFLTPLRIFSPNIGNSGTADSNLLMLMSGWKSNMAAMIAKRRKDPTAMFAVPFPVNYQEAGAQGKSMVLKDVVEVYTDALFDGLGFPRELYRGSLNMEQIPTSIRMFERQYEWLFCALSGAASHVADVVQKASDGVDLEVALKRPSMAYNAEFMQLKMNLAANREIPRSEVYGDMGIKNPAASMAAAVEEDNEAQRLIAPISANFEKEMTQGSMADVAIAQAEQGMEGGGDPAAGGGGGGGGQPGGEQDFSVDTNADPTMIQQRADVIGAEWVQMHEQQPNSHVPAMRKAEATNPTLYAAAKQVMEKIRSQGASAGRAQAGQMLGGQQ